MIKIIGNISHWNNSSEEFDANINELIAQGIQDAVLYLNTYGGSTFEAFEIVNILKRFPGTITAELGAVCASSGTIISSSFDHVKAATNTQFMVHRPMIGIDGNEDEVESGLKLLRNTQKLALDLYVKKTGKPAETLDAKWKSDWWMTAEEAKAEGFIDEIDGEATIDPEDLAGLSMKKYKNLPQSIAAVLKTAPPKNTVIKPKIREMKTEVIAAMVGLDSNTEEAKVQAELEAKLDKAKKYDALVAAQAKEKEEAAKKEIKEVIDTAVTDKVITNDVRNHYENIGEKSGIDTLKAVLKNTPKAEKISGKVKEKNGSEGSDMSYEDYQEKGQLKTLKAEDPEKFEKLFAAYQEKIKKQ